MGCDPSFFREVVSLLCLQMSVNMPAHKCIHMYTHAQITLFDKYCAIILASVNLHDLLF